MIKRIIWSRMSAVALVIVGLGGFVALSATGPSADSEAQVKAGYLYKLVSFVRWPADTFADGQAPLRICIAGRDDIFMATRALVHGRRAAGHPLRTERIDPAHPETAARCQILFIGQEGPAARRPIAQAGDRPVLTVTDRSAGVHGGIIEFVRAGDNVRFAIHRKAAEARQLELSSKLLAVAELIEP